jgi:uncharacterized membrane protein YcaP (DUF421 family)
MLETLWDQAATALALTTELGEMDAGPMALRTVVVYAFTLALVRLGSRRLLARASAFDVIVAIMLGSIVSRAINGTAPFIPTLLAGAALLATHLLLAALAFRFDWFSSVMKGERIALIRNGEMQRSGMRRASVTRGDLDEALRLETGHADPSKIELAYMERSGRISVIPYRGEPRVLAISVENGVQTVRIEVQ